MTVQKPTDNFIIPKLPENTTKERKMEQYLEPELLKLKAKLQQKKNALRKELSEMGIQKREGENSYDRYKYFSEAQYKLLFTKLFSKHGLELRSSEADYQMYEVEGKQPHGRIVKYEYELIDIETGYSETSYASGEGLDKGDKAGYKAATGAIKYYLADTFLVATGDDAEKESPEAEAIQPRKVTPKQTTMASAEQCGEIMKLADLDQLKGILDKYAVEKVEDLDVLTAGKLIKRLKELRNEQGSN